MKNDYSKVPCCIMRGGTSKGVFFYEDDIPPEGKARDAFLCAVMGSPDVRQINGLGGADPLTSKVAIVKKSDRLDADIDYTFAQVSLTSGTVDYNGNCGNITSAVGLFAVEEGIVTVKGQSVLVRILNKNTNKILKVDVPCENGRPARSGNYAIDGVPGKGPKLNLDFSETGGAVSGKLLPTGKLVDHLNVSGYGVLDATIVDIANPVVFVRAVDLGLKGDETPEDIACMPDLLSVLECIRGVAAQKIGLVDDWKRAQDCSPAIPLLAIVSHAKDEKASLTSRLIFMQTMHKTYSGTAAVCTAVAAKIPGTIPYTYAKQSTADFLIAHPAGYMMVEIEVRIEKENILIQKAAFGRTARRLIEGYVYTL
ncbi:PrpF domain-containing protein [Lutispora sp.]|uniref:PrpF domain-containing protein n=1 Tax=Lutispora sp. TaxID=2828727 RepID=UPI002B1FADD3|nr:PrpF domain-containing protein [Lutispora sp.]MEA4962369.1 PrpF domain-containing protein [Lutispora sp.]